ncbi:FG-GAP repeat protein [Luteolibacter algae]|uniref:FG-GAP repeat protein n=1 Tax=Luteolibacter algae TaxID=454151 RepID=A0ABW5D3R8_9BACT
MKYLTLLFLSLGLAAGQADEYIKAPAPAADENSGHAIAMGPELLVIGAPGSDEDTGRVDIYRKISGQWVFEDSLFASDKDYSARFGAAAAISGDTIVIGSPFRAHPDDPSFFADPAGAAYVFKLESGSWVEQQRLSGSNTGSSDNFGYSVAIEGDTIVIGARWEQGAEDRMLDSGAAYVFSRNGNIWAEEAYLKASNAGELDEFGTAVAISAGTVAVSAPFEDGNGAESGAVYLFDKQTGGWTERQILRAADASPGDFFGCSLAMDSERIAIGARGEDDVANASGAVYLFRKSSSGWLQETRLKSVMPVATAEMGTTVSLSAARLIAGAPKDPTGGNNSGSATRFRLASGTWGEPVRMTAANQGPGDNYGSAVSIQGLDLAVGAESEDGADNLISASGAAYLSMLSPKSFREWSIAENLSGDLAGQDADPDLDGVPNLIEYANHMLSSPLPASTFSYTGSGGLFTFSRPSEFPSDLVLIVEQSTNLREWDEIARLRQGNWTGNSAQNILENTHGEIISATVQPDDRPPLEPRLFLRSSIELTAD